jgi:hypothetical protein
MELHLVTWKSSKLQTGKRDFLVKEAFDNSDAILKVKRQIAPEWLGAPGESFSVNRVVFNEQDTFPIVTR